LRVPRAHELVLARDDFDWFAKPLDVLASIVEDHQLVAVFVGTEACFIRSTLSSTMKERDHDDPQKTNLAR
jgi:hypothetical protein